MKLNICQTQIIAMGWLAVMVLAAGAAYAAEIDCEIPNHVECTVTDPQGIQRVTVTLATGQGPVAVVDETFSCPRTAEVSWDPIVPGAQIEVETCESPVLVYATQVGRDETEDRDVLVLARRNGARDAAPGRSSSIGVSCDDAPVNGVRLVLGARPGARKDVCDGCDSCVFGCCWDGFPVKCNELTSKTSG